MYKIRQRWRKELGGIQAYSRLTTTHGHITDCKLDSGVCRCMLGDLMWAYRVWAERSTPDNFWVPSHRFNSATGEQTGITRTIYTESEPPSRMLNSLMPSAKLRSANHPVFTSLVWRPRPAAPRADALTTVLRRAVMQQGFVVAKRDRFSLQDITKKLFSDFFSFSSQCKSYTLTNCGVETDDRSEGHKAISSFPIKRLYG